MAQPVALLTSAGLRDRFPADAPAFLPGDWPAKGTAPEGPAPGDTAYVIYASGSTGEPKGVVIEQRAIVNRLWWMRDHYRIGPGDRIRPDPVYPGRMAGKVGNESHRRRGRPVRRRPLGPRPLLAVAERHQQRQRVLHRRGRGGDAADQRLVPPARRADRGMAGEGPGSRQRGVEREEPAEGMTPERPPRRIDRDPGFRCFPQGPGQPVEELHRPARHPAGMHRIGPDAVAGAIGRGEVQRPPLARELAVGVVADACQHQPRRHGQMVGSQEVEGRIAVEQVENSASPPAAAVSAARRGTAGGRDRQRQLSVTARRRPACMVGRCPSGSGHSGPFPLPRSRQADLLINPINITGRWRSEARPDCPAQLRADPSSGKSP